MNSEPKIGKFAQSLRLKNNHFIHFPSGRPELDHFDRIGPLPALNADHAVAFEFAIQGGAPDLQLLGGAGLIAGVQLQRRENVFFLHIFERKNLSEAGDGFESGPFIHSHRRAFPV